MSGVLQIVHQDQESLVDGAAHRLVDRLVAVQAEQSVAQVCLTGGRIANRIYARVAELIPGSALDGSRIELWWGDERFVPTDSPDRNAQSALTSLAATTTLDSSRVHPMPAADGNVSIEDHAARYAAELGDTVFDVCLLGVGPDGHVASLFPDHPSSEPSTSRVIAVHDSPKPPPERISVTMEVINRSREVWFLVSGADKASAVAAALDGDQRLPAARAHGSGATVWLIDEAAASQV